MLIVHQANSILRHHPKSILSKFTTVSIRESDDGILDVGGMMDWGNEVQILFVN